MRDSIAEGPSHRHMRARLDRAPAVPRAGRVPTASRAAWLACALSVVAAGAARAGQVEVFKDSFEAIEVACDDGVDNNGDGLTDCGDRACRGRLLFRTSNLVSAEISTLTVSQGKVFVGAGNSLRGHDTSGNLIGAGTTTASAPIVAVVASSLQDGSDYLFYASEDGVLHTVRQSTMQEIGARSIRRMSCAQDSAADVVVQEVARSNAAFTPNQDLLYAATAHACGDTTQNRILALPASNLSASPVWVFNLGEFEIDAFVGCSLDYASNTLFCTSGRATGASQHTVWAIDSATGALRWSADAGTASTKPALLGAPLQQVIVGDSDALIRSYSPMTGAPYWDLPLSVSPGETRVNSILPLLGDVLAYAVGAPDSRGAMSPLVGGAYVEGTFPGGGQTAWSRTAPGTRFAAYGPAFDPEGNYLYALAGVADAGGTRVEVQQLDALNGALVARADAGGTVWPDPLSALRARLAAEHVPGAGVRIATAAGADASRSLALRCGDFPPGSVLP